MFIYLQRRARFNVKRLRLGQSLIDGYGLFATRDIQEDDVIAEYVGEIVSAQVSFLCDLNAQSVAVRAIYR